MTLYKLAHLKTATFSWCHLIKQTDFIINHSNAQVINVKPVKSISQTYDDSTEIDEIQNHPFHKLSYKEKSKLCTDAQKYASKNEIVLKHVDSKTVELNRFTIFEEYSELGQQQIGLKCPTAPSSILLAPVYPRTVVEEMDFVVEENPFLKHTFLDEIILRFNRKVDIVVDANFFMLNESQKWELCTAASSRLDYDIIMLTGIDQSARIVGLLGIVYLNGIEVDFEAVLQCNSSPRMFLRNPGISTNAGNIVYMVMLLENEISSTNRHQEENEISVSSQENFVSASTCSGPNC